MSEGISAAERAFTGDPARAAHVNSLLAGLAAGALAGSVVLALASPLIDFFSYPKMTAPPELPLELARGLAQTPSWFGIWLTCLIVASPVWGLLHWLGARGWASALSLGICLSLVVISGFLLLLPVRIIDGQMIGASIGLAALGGGVGVMVWFVAYRLAHRLPRTPFLSLSPRGAHSAPKP